MKCQFHISEILSWNHIGFTKIDSNYFSISAAKNSGAFAPLVRQSISSLVFHMLRAPTRFYLWTVFFLYLTLFRKTAFCLGQGLPVDGSPRKLATRSVSGRASPGIVMAGWEQLQGLWEQSLSSPCPRKDGFPHLYSCSAYHLSCHQQRDSPGFVL